MRKSLARYYSCYVYRWYKHTQNRKKKDSDCMDRVRAYSFLSLGPTLFVLYHLEKEVLELLAWKRPGQMCAEKCWGSKEHVMRPLCVQWTWLSEILNFSYQYVCLLPCLLNQKIINNIQPLKNSRRHLARWVRTVISTLKVSVGRLAKGWD